MMIFQKLFFILIALVLSYTSAQSQQACGVSSHLEYIDQDRLELLKKKHQHTKSNELRVIPLMAHAVTESDRYGDYLTSIKRGVEQVNEQFAALNMRFMLCDEVNFISNDSFPRIRFEVSNIIHRDHKVDGAINMYMVEELETGGGGRACGWATLPWWRDSGNDYIFMAENCMDDNTTLAHEIGHFLGLLHTHNVARLDSLVLDPITKDTINLGIEFVDQSNCEIAGDMICDTPADPLLGSGNVNAACEYTGSEEDPFGVPYSTAPPDPTNRMSYARRSCMSTFSPTQVDIMNMWLAERTPELTCVGAREIKLLSFTSSTDDYVIDEDFDIAWEISNYGLSNEDVSLDFKLYLSKNGIIDDNDLILEQQEDIDITKNGLSQKNFTVKIPSEYDQTGIHFLLLEIDPNKEHLVRSLKGKITVFLDSAATTATNTIEKQSLALNIKPNPAHDYININTVTNDSWIRFYDQKGSLVKHEKIQAQTNIEVGELQSGIYLIQIISAEGKTIALDKFVKL